MSTFWIHLPFHFFFFSTPLFRYSFGFTIYLSLIQKLGLLALLDEESRFPKGTDLTLLAKLNSTHEKNSFYEIQKRLKSHFVIKHFAGDVRYFSSFSSFNDSSLDQVTYDVTNWLYKNRDTLQPDLLSVLQSSSNRFITNLFPDTIGEGNKKVTTGGQFKVHI